MPRTKDIIWNNFERIKSGTATGYKAKCKACGILLQGIVDRMRVHADKCSGATETDEEVIVIEQPSQQQPSTTGGNYFINGVSVDFLSILVNCFHYFHSSIRCSPVSTSCGYSLTIV